MISGIFCRSIEKGFFKGEKDAGMNSKVKIQKVSRWSICLTLVLTVLVSGIGIWSMREFQMLKNATDRYIECEEAARQLQTGADYLTEQVRLYTMTGEKQYMDNYFKEKESDKKREASLESIKKEFGETEMYYVIQDAYKNSEELMTTEYKAMRLVVENTGLSREAWPQEIQDIKLAYPESDLSASGKMRTAQLLVSNNRYQAAKERITNKCQECKSILADTTRNVQEKSIRISKEIVKKLEGCMAVLVALIVIISVIIRKLIVKPLLSYNESIKNGEIFPVIGAAELQNLAETYNTMYRDMQETQKLIRHEAENDALTELLNRRYFDKILRIYDEGKSSFALILIDVDTFKTVNDTYGHATGDEILRRVAALLKQTFRNIDYVCRIGGDEFAIVMVEMTSELKYTIREKINYINQILLNPEDDLPPVSLSVGAAFADRENPGESIFKDADKALYYVKEHGRNGCSFY